MLIDFGVSVVVRTPSHRPEISHPSSRGGVVYRLSTNQLPLTKRGSAGHYSLLFCWVDSHLNWTSACPYFIARTHKQVVYGRVKLD